MLFMKAERNRTIELSENEKNKYFERCIRLDSAVKKRDITDFFNTEYKDIIGTSSTSSLIAAFIKEEQDASKLERLEQIIQKRKKEIEEIR